MDLVELLREKKDTYFYCLACVDSSEDNLCRIGFNSKHELLNYYED